jgi:uncharacterized protein YjbJ (UPF0337 family)
MRLQACSKQRFSNPTDDDLLFEEGREEESSGRWQKKLGKTREGIHNLMARL